MIYFIIYFCFLLRISFLFGYTSAIMILNSSSTGKYSEVINMNNIINLADRRGKIFIGTIDNYDTIDANLYLFCTTYSNTVPDGTILVDQLAPSFNLFLEKRAWIEKNVLADKFVDFQEKYLSEMHTRDDYILALDKIREFIREGKNIVLFDNCNLGNLCHLHILKDVLIKEGFRVEVIGGISHRGKLHRRS